MVSIFLSNILDDIFPTCQLSKVTEYHKRAMELGDF